MSDKKAALEALDKLYNRIYYGGHEEYETIRKALSYAVEWRDISTAPRDGKNILLYCDGDTRKGYADEYGFYIINNGDYGDGGYGNDYRCEKNNTKYDYGYSMPTHWMPLPTSPTKGDEG